MNIDKKRALNAIYGALDWLIRHGLTGHQLEWLGEEYPLLRIDSPRDILVADDFLTFGSEQPSTTTALYGTFRDRFGDQRAHFAKPLYVAFTFKQYGVGDRVPQKEEVTRLFRERYGSGNFLVEPSNWHTNAAESVKEEVTNFIAARYFILQGYLVASENLFGGGPDLLAMKSELVKQLIENGLMRKGADIQELSTLWNLGRVAHENIPEPYELELIAVESEGVNPKGGITQLLNGYSGNVAVSTRFFDRRVLAVPFTQTLDGFQLDDLEVLVYDEGGEGIQFPRSNGPRTIITDPFWQRQRLDFVDTIHHKMTMRLVDNFTVNGVLDLIPDKDPTILRMLELREQIGIGQVLPRLLDLGIERTQF